MEFTSTHYKPLIYTAILFAAILFINCAEIGPPPGGEIDKLKPRIISSVPENGAVNVSPGNEIVIHFSERITKPASGKSIYISPRLPEKPKVKWKSDHITITLPDSFKTDQTYIISLASGIKDLRNNPIDSGSIIAFSTGDELSSGKISGFVKNDLGKPENAMLIGLYNKKDFNASTFIDSLYPDYFAVTDKEGFFTFQYIPNNKYIVLGISDRNKDERFNPDREYFAVTDREIVLDSLNQFENLLLTVNPSDTSSPEIQSVRYLADRLVHLSLSKEIDLNLIQTNLSNLILKSIDSDSTSYPCLFLMESDVTAGNSLNGYFGEIPDGLYICELLYKKDHSAIYKDSIKIERFEDETNPKIIYFQPDIFPIFLNDLDISLQFSEPIDTAKLSSETFVILDNDSNIIIPSTEIINSSYLNFSSAQLQEGNQYSFIVSEFDIFDITGNSLGDSTKSYTLNIVDTDSVGTISGEVSIIPEDKLSAPIFLQFDNIKTKQSYTNELSGSKFSLELPAGKYVLSGYIDSDKNGIRSKGSIFPFKYSEWYTTHPDTISVRARFETSDIKLNFR